MVAARYVPERGDVVWVSFSPIEGHEQAGHRPALVLSPSSYNARSGLMLCCPITSKVKPYPFVVPILGDADVAGAAREKKGARVGADLAGSPGQGSGAAFLTERQAT